MRLSIGRADKSPLARWFWTIDRPLLAMLLVLIGVRDHRRCRCFAGCRPCAFRAVRCRSSRCISFSAS
jgi:hypothetical protein